MFALCTSSDVFLSVILTAICYLLIFIIAAFLALIVSLAIAIAFLSVCLSVCHYGRQNMCFTQYGREIIQVSCGQRSWLRV